MNMQETVAALCAAEGVTGRGCAVQELALKLLRPYAPDAQIDALGSVTGTMGAGRKTILLDAHLDQIGLVVTSLAERGFLHVGKVGGMDRRVLIGKPVVVYGREPVHAVISSVPPHLASKEDGKLPEWGELLVDTGLSEAEATRLIAPGDPILLDVKPQMLLNGRMTAQALDNRCSVAAVLRSLELVSGEMLPCRVAVQFSMHEETNSAGAVTSAFRADAQEAIAVDVSFARAPGTPPDIRAKLGRGVLIGVAASLDRVISDTLIRLAEEQQIPYQIEAMGGSTGTNADPIAVSRGGVPTGLLSIPQRNMHTGVEVIDRSDVESTARLLAAYLRSGGRR